jgi:hypothetical protein
MRDSLIAFAASDSHFAREMMLSMTWAVYAIALVVIRLNCC